MLSRAYVLNARSNLLRSFASPLNGFGGCIRRFTGGRRLSVSFVFSGVSFLFTMVVNNFNNISLFASIGFWYLSILFGEFLAGDVDVVLELALDRWLILFLRLGLSFSDDVGSSLSLGFLLDGNAKLLLVVWGRGVMDLVLFGREAAAGGKSSRMML
jgi:hypothetical protein